MTTSAQRIVAEFARRKVIPVVVVDDAAHTDELASALVAGQLPLVEVTMRTPAATDALKSMASDSRMLVGAGTVLTEAQAEFAASAGARFVMTPGFAPRVVRECQTLGIPIFSGVSTPTEIQMALDAGLTTLKFFPASINGGPAMIRALAQPFGDVTFIPTGGIDASNCRDYLTLDEVVAVGGSWVASRQLIRSRKYREITELALGAVDMCGPMPEEQIAPKGAGE